MKSTVTVIIPAFNRGRTIARALYSVQHQGEVVSEIVVVDDASTDDTIEIVRKVAMADSRVQLVTLTANQGAQVARNAGIQAASGEWIAFLDSDDEFLAGSISCRLAMALKTGCQVVHSECLVIRKGQEIPTEFGVPPISGNVYNELLAKPGPMFQGLLVRREALIHIGYLDNDIVSYQEWDTCIRLSRYYEFEFVESPTFLYDCRGTDTISKNLLRDANGYEQIVRKHARAIGLNCGLSTLAIHCSEIAFRYDRVQHSDVAAKYRRLGRLLKITPRNLIKVAKRVFLPSGK